MRGYGSTPRAARGWQRRGAGAHGLPRIALHRHSRHDLHFALAATAVLAVSIATAIAGLARFHAYPLVSLGLGPGVVAVCVALTVLALAPFADRRGIEP